jgi:hypothetical protein
VYSERLFFRILTKETQTLGYKRTTILYVVFMGVKLSLSHQEKTQIWGVSQQDAKSTSR